MASSSFDFDTLSLTIDATMEEYQRNASGELGLNLPEIAMGDRSRFLSFRHEHAHFTSFVASGLADLHGVVSDYLLVMLWRIVDERLSSGDPLTLPIYPDRALRQDTRPEDTVARAAWQQVMVLRGCLFGFGTRHTLEEMTNLDVQDAFWDPYYDNAFEPIVERYYRMTALLRQGIDGADTAVVRALPRLALAAGERRLSARSVMEAYALSIELMATHLRSWTTDTTFYSRATARNPGPLYSTALEYALEQTDGPKVSLHAFQTYDRDTDVDYNRIAVMTFAAMQVPVLQHFDGEVFMEGTLGTLSVAHRFEAIVDGIRAGRIPPVPTGLRDGHHGDEPLLAWMTECHRALGDPFSVDLSRVARATLDEHDDLGAMTAETQSLIELSWAARANFARSPSEWVLDAGLWVDDFPCQPRYIRTSDGKLASIGDHDAFQERYILEHAVPVLEAVVFGERWDSTWDKLPEIPPEGRLQMVQAVIFLTMARFGLVEPDGLPRIPQVELTL